MKDRIVDLTESYQALIGECAWHSLTVDPTLKTVSDAHYQHIVNSLQHYGRLADASNMKILEVASYAHTTGYRLQQELGCQVTLFDISAKALQLGRRMADSDGLAVRPQLVAGDFHALPFQDSSFDLIHISSALHHTWKYETVIAELQRVLAPGGLLLFLNEPCHRECCFYRFRTNRPADFTKFERELDRLGIIRTFAEPYLGSRPETLFGMIENQMIPLGHLLDLLNSSTKIIQLLLTPEDCMGDLEKSWLDDRDKGLECLSSIIESTLVERRAEAMKHFDEVAEGLQFHLPSLDELKPFARRVAQALCNLSPVSDQEKFRIGVSEIFGASVQIAVEKPRGQFHRPGHTLKDGLESDGYIIYAFDERVRRIFLHDSSLLPDIQTADEAQIANFFPSECWQYNARLGMIALALKSLPGRFRIPASRRDLLFVMRYYSTVPEHASVRIRIQHLDRELYGQRIWQSESLLWVELFPSGNDVIELELTREVIALNGECELSPGGLEVAFVGAFEIE